MRDTGNEVAFPVPLSAFSLVFGINAPSKGLCLKQGTGNGGTGMGEWGNGNGNPLKGGISKIGNL